jgi:AcrR family transcriptional regulator
MATPSRAPDRRLRADARRNRQRILAAARDVFSREGSGAQVDDIARRADVGVGTVYRHFPTKEALIEELVAERFRTFAEHARQALDVEDPWEAFSGVLRRNAEVMASDAALRDELARTGAMRTYAGDQRAELEIMGRELIERGRRAGVLRDDLTIDDIPMLMAGLCASMSVPECNWRRHLELLLDGMRARG